MAEKKQDFTKYEVARILGARALQLAMDAPLLIDIDKKEIEKLNYDTLKIAELEFENNALPITVKRPLPKKKKEKIKREKTAEEKKEEEEKLKEAEKQAKKEAEAEEKEVQEIVKEGHEIMELSTPEDEKEEVEDKSEKEI